MTLRLTGHRSRVPYKLPYVLLLALATSALSGCGYALAGRGSFLPERIKVIGIPPKDTK